jgi:hypothetical protein
VQIGYLTRNDFAPGQMATQSWLTPAEFSEDGKRIAQADLLEGLNIASVFLRTGSGHSNQVFIEHII